MRHSCLFVAVSLSVLTLSGCRMESTGSSAFNPATNVDLVFSTFDLTNTEQAPDTLSFTRFSDFYQGIQPTGDNADNEDHLATVEEIRRHIDIFIGAQPDDTGQDYTRVRNPLDLMNQVIGVGGITNFDEGRRYIRDRIALSQAGNYNTRSAGARIRFTDQAASFSLQPLNDYEWNYQTLDWRYLPEGPEGSELTEKVYRTIQYVARSVNDDVREEQPELLSVLAGSRFDALQFVASGYNQPEYATADYVSRNHGGIELRQTFVTDAQLDTLFIKNTEQTVIDLSRYGADNTTPDCLRVEINYAMDTVHIYTSDGEPARVPDDGAEDDDATKQNPDNCVYQSEDFAIATWNAASASTRK
ncbi:hypothetical protein ASQ50_10330 [Marinobacter sp. LQ44]|nr:hypothetical protein ASQ50_10330 [Marinobacter sp. LQ44]